MQQREVFKYYRKYSEDLETAYSIIKSCFTKSYSEYADEICQLRGYTGEEQRALLESMEIGCCEIPDVTVLGDRRMELGLVSDKDNFLLNGRYIIPIRDITGTLVALVGWYPDWKKYITTRSVFFSKNVLFFNIDQAYELSWKEYNGILFVVEGVFDALSLRAIGLPAVATMGVTVRNPKSEQLKLFRKSVALPDSDKAGKRALSRGTKHSWTVPPNTTFARLQGNCVTEFGTLKVKDVDNLVSYFDVEGVRETFLELAKSTEELEIIRL